ncbi:hypothetical protein [Rurimicrobium arvi]|uniref:Membrane protein n=1 Tax=Rurimicrobium arvi TaxID=2049916 RepID=A0ABP8MX22_9BACT
MPFPVLAQNISRPYENNPYSRYGVGEEFNAINPAIKAMGGISAVYQDPYIVNTENPASYATIKNFTYEGGAEGRSRTIISGNSRYRTGAFALSYLNLAIPMGKYAGAVIGFKPVTKVNYLLYDTVQSLIGPTSYEYSGTGGLNNFFIGAAAKIKGLSVGVNFGYMFGTIRQSNWYKTTVTTNYVNNSEFISSNSMGGFNFKLGLTYEHDLGKDYMLRIGGTADLSQKINTEVSEFWISHPFYSSDTTGSDTAYSVKSAMRKITLPGSYSGGIFLAKGDRWGVGVTYKTTNWSQFSKPNIIDSIGSSAYKVALGAEYTPNVLSLYKYWQRVTYRAGFNLGNDYVSINGKQANYYAATFGLSLPFRRTNDRIHTSFEIGKLGNSANGLLQQNFIRFNIGVSFNDKSWFVKRKYD